jgi:uncharacterized damage-inducible protein DinB
MAAKRKKKQSKKAITKRITPKSPNYDRALRQQLQEVLTWHGAHLDWKPALADLPVEKRGLRPAGLPHSAWELLEHARIAQHDILDFCVNPKYKSLEWPSGYWPITPAPPDDAAWQQSIRSFENDARAMARLLEDRNTNIFAKIPHGSGQTILREALLLVDHNAYHLGQFVLVRRSLGAWKET